MENDEVTYKIHVVDSRDTFSPDVRFSPDKSPCLRRLDELLNSGWKIHRVDSLPDDTRTQLVYILMKV